MSSVTEEIEITYREAYWCLPKCKIPILYIRDIGTHKRQYGTSDEHDTRVGMLFEFANETVTFVHILFVLMVSMG
jgi:hypothetical protein